MQDTDGIEFFNTIIMQPHLKLITNAGRGYHVRCAYKNRDVAIKKREKHYKNSSGTHIKPPQAYRSGKLKESDRKSHGRSLDKSEQNSESDNYDSEAEYASDLTSAENDSADYVGDNVVTNNDTNLSEIEVPMPGCHMKIYNARNNIATDVNIGDPLTLVVNIDQQPLYGLHVTDCIVRDGIGWGEQRLVGEDG